MSSESREILLSAWNILSAENSLERVLEVVCQTSRALSRATWVTIALIEGNRLQYVHADGIPSTTIKSMRHDLGVGIPGKVAESGVSKRVRLSDSPVNQRSEQDSAFPPTPRCVLCVPMRFQGKVIGTLQAFNKRDSDDFTQDEETDLQTFADQAAMAVERFRLNEQLLAESRRIRGLFEALTDGIMVVDPQGSPLMYNKAVEELFFPNGQQNYSLTTYLSTLIKRGTSQGTAEVVLFKPHGVVLSNRYVVLRDSKGQPTEVVVSIRNVTDQRALDRRFSQFYAIMLRKANLLLSRALKAKKSERRRRLMRRQAKLSRNLVFLTELKSGPLRIEKEPGNLVEIYKRIRNRNLRRLEKLSITLKDDGFRNGPAIPVRVQTDLFKQVFSALFVKSRHALSKGGEVTIEGQAKDGRARIAVTLSGIGVQEQFNPETLDWNFQVDKIIAGDSKILDLELAFLKHILQAHKGNVTIDEPTENLAVVHLDLPLDEEREEEE